ncbi:MAG: hypothetical protein ABUK01_18120 [Leptospirales bacterium]
MNPELIYDEYNKKFPETNAILEAIVNNDQTHARWLNVLSYLEYIGSRKIFKTQTSEVMNETILRHASDEARHALILKQLIEKLDSNQLESYDSNNLLFGFSGFRYFQSLDAMVKNEIAKDARPKTQTAYLCYVYVSLIIEIRANWLYELYAKVLKKLNSPVSVSSIINDEVRHLADTLKEIENIDDKQVNRIEHFVQQESEYFNRFYEALRNNILASVDS